MALYDRRKPPTETVEVPLWAAVELAQDERTAALSRILELGISKRYVARLCDVQTKQVTVWLKDGCPRRFNNRSMAMLSRLSGLLDHMLVDLQLSREQALDFLRWEQNDYDHQDDDSFEKTQWRHARLLSNLGNVSVGYSAEFVNTVEDRLRQRFPDNYSIYEESPAPKIASIKRYVR